MAPDAGIITEIDGGNDAVETLQNPPAPTQRGRTPRSQEPEFTAVDTDSEFNLLHDETHRGDAPSDTNLAADNSDADLPLLEQQDRAREPRAQRRERQRQAKDRNQQELMFLRRRVGELEGYVHGIEPRLSNYDQAQAASQLQALDRDIDGQAQVAAHAYARMSEAMTNADGAAFARALADRDKAIMTGQQLTVRKNLLSTGDVLGRSVGRGEAPRQPQAQQQAAPRIPSAVQDRIDDFATRHDWYNPRDPRSVESRIVLDLDNAVAADGFDPAGADYWDELEDRMREYLPRRFPGEDAPSNAAPQRRAPQQQASAAAPAPQRRGPMMGAPADRGPAPLGANQVYISPERKQAMILAGVLDTDGRTVTNREKHKALLKQYHDYDRTNGVVRQ